MLFLEVDFEISCYFLVFFRRFTVSGVDINRVKEEVEIFLIGELSLKIKVFSPRNISEVVIIVKKSMAEYLEKRGVALPLGVQNEAEQNVIFALIERFKVSPEVKLSLRDLVRVFYLSHYSDN